MKVSRAALTTLAAVIPCCYTRAFATSTALPATTSSTPTLFSTARATAKSIQTTTALPMIFEKLFSSFAGGGGFGAKIDYTTLPYPCPELATTAAEGKVLENIERGDNKYKVASFAGGCFWGFELAYQRVPGVEYTAVGYQQGPEEQPSYDQVCAGATKHTEAVFVIYDPKICSYESLLDAFFGRIDPLTVNGQGGDRGTQYRTGVYFHSPEQEKLATKRFAEEQEKYGSRKIASECTAAMPFWPAEKYHQQYLEKGGRSNSPQSAEKGCTETIRCYG
mmetsp:Transcript_6289/g.7311  ORF Transcript_6289/g.7311 Transcript_6289/m.7311 type:complete len:278 (-) Transcript_6289:216-1049(-)